MEAVIPKVALRKQELSQACGNHVIWCFAVLDIEHFVLSTAVDNADHVRIRGEPTVSQAINTWILPKVGWCFGGLGDTMGRFRPPS
jgi:hypothetical protein